MMEILKNKDMRLIFTAIFISIAAVIAPVYIRTSIGMTKLNDACNDEYTIYLDGEEIKMDTDDIRPSKYYISINDDKKSIYLTERQGYHNIFSFIK